MRQVKLARDVGRQIKLRHAIEKYRTPRKEENPYQRILIAARVVGFHCLCPGVFSQSCALPLFGCNAALQCAAQCAPRSFISAASKVLVLPRANEEGTSPEAPGWKRAERVCLH